VCALEKSRDYGQIQPPRLSYKCETPEGDAALNSQCTHTVQAPHSISASVVREESLKEKLGCKEEQKGLEIAE